ncbi:NTP transferase domain-containing protein [Candidatus Poribacteria bacterium]|nr:NTP transferase domain-containing protein [Candidatus Poribacteria bacterium]
MQAIILCGGLSTRLGKTTEKIPKILLTIGNRTVLNCQIDLLSKAGVSEVILASGHLHDVIYSQVGEDMDGVKIRYAKEEKPLGTGGAIQNAFQFVDEFPVFVLHGDILLKGFSLTDMLSHLRQEMEGLLLGVSVSDLSSYGEIVADNDGRITQFREKQNVRRPGCANGAIFLFNHRITDAFPDKEVFSIERDVFPKLQNLYVHKVDSEWIDIGVPERLEYARKHFIE